MTHSPLRFALLAAFALGAGGCSSANGGSSDAARNPEENGASFEAGTDAGENSVEAGTDAGENSVPGPDVSGALQILPRAPSLDVVPGKPNPEVQFTAMVAGEPVEAAFSFDRADLGSLSASGHFVASGTGVGTGVVTARWREQTASTTITLHLELRQNGESPGDGGGGWGGIGGEGMGGPVSAPVEAILASEPMADSGLTLLYPYDGTVWPKDILPPLLQWSSASRDFEALSIELRCSSVYFRGSFARTATPFSHHPIPPAAWRQIHSACAGESVSLRLVFASGNAAYGPLQATWKIASSPLKGTVYYNSYGTRLAKNAWGALGPESKFGGATLAIAAGAAEPTLVAGRESDDKSGCRVCHVVGSRGTRLVTQHGEDYSLSSLYDLTAPNQETPLPQGGHFAWGALSPDGSLLFSNSVPLAGTVFSPGVLYSLPSGEALPMTGLPPDFCTGTPVFSNNGRRLAFNWCSGKVGKQSGDGRSLAVMDFAPPGDFSNVFKVFTPSDPKWKVFHPSFTPDGARVVFHLELVGNGRDIGGTRANCLEAGPCGDQGARAELWQVDVATQQAARLDRLNGAGYLPKGPAAHDDDATLNYEPAVAPVVSGGYAWVVFTSRRLYGNVATINPYWSDPRVHDISSTPTTKKLWVAAIDLSAPPGSDPSHPAFYLPAQELFAGNFRSFWTAEACREMGEACESGDQCCTGSCSPSSGELGGQVCSGQSAQAPQ